MADTREVRVSDEDVLRFLKQHGAVGGLVTKFIELAASAAVYERIRTTPPSPSTAPEECAKSANCNGKTDMALASRPAEVDDEGLRDAAEAMIEVLDDYPEQLVPINRLSVTVRRLRDAVAADRARRGDGWISVDDQMPPRYRRAYLVYTPGNKCVVTGHVSINDDGDEQWYHFASGRYIAERVSHWMELPAAPSHTTNKEK